MLKKIFIITLPQNILVKRAREKEFEAKQPKKKRKKGILKKTKPNKKIKSTIKDKKDKTETEENIKINALPEIDFELPDSDEDETDRDRHLYIKYKDVNFLHPKIPIGSHYADVSRDFRQRILDKLIIAFSKRYERRKKVVVHSFQAEKKLYNRNMKSNRVYWMGLLFFFIANN